MSSSTPPIAESLLKIIENYKREEDRPKETIREFLHFHVKNPDAAQQISLLQDIRQIIIKNLTGKEQKLAELGALLIFRALISDANPEGQVFIYLNQKLGLDQEIAKALKAVDPTEEMDPTHADYINTSEEAIRFCKNIIQKLEIMQKYSGRFIKDLMGTIETELDYDDRVLLTLNPPKPV